MPKINRFYKRQIARRLPYMCTHLKPLDGMRCHLAGSARDTRVVPSNIALGGAPLPTGRGDFGGSEPPVKICIANCGQTVTGSGMVIIGSLWELSNALSNGTIADPIRLLLPPNNTFAAMPPIVILALLLLLVLYPCMIHYTSLHVAQIIIKIN